jgi:hypothetical protein
LLVSCFACAFKLHHWKRTTRLRETPDKRMRTEMLRLLVANRIVSAMDS